MIRHMAVLLAVRHKEKMTHAAFSNRVISHKALISFGIIPRPITVEWSHEMEAVAERKQQSNYAPLLALQQGLYGITF